MDVDMVRHPMARLRDSFRKNRVMLFLYFALLSGIAVGPSLVRTELAERTVTQLASYFRELYQNESIVLYFLAVLFAELVSLLPHFLMGSSFLGFLACPILLCAGGMAVGCYFAGYYLLFGLNGLIYCLAVVTLPTLVCAGTWLFAARETVSFSLLQFCDIKRGCDAEKRWKDIKLYSERFLFYFCFLIASSLLACLCARVFGGLSIFSQI